MMLREGCGTTHSNIMTLIFPKNSWDMPPNTLDEKENFLIKEMCMTVLNFRHISFFYRKFGSVMCRMDQIS